MDAHPLAPSVIVGLVLGASAASQRVALPGAVLLGGAFDAAVAASTAVAPEWFPTRERLSLGQVLATAAGVVGGWFALRLLARGNPTPPAWAAPAITVGAAALAMGAVSAPVGARLPRPALRFG